MASSSSSASSAAGKQSKGALAYSSSDALDGRQPITPGVLRGLAIGYLMLIALGVIVFMLPGATIKGNAFSVERSVFTVVNAITLTDFSKASRSTTTARPAWRACSR
jgi:hypothetical protein